MHVIGHDHEIVQLEFAFCDQRTQHIDEQSRIAFRLQKPAPHAGSCRREKVFATGSGCWPETHCGRDAPWQGLKPRPPFTRCYGPAKAVPLLQNAPPVTRFRTLSSTPPPAQLPAPWPLCRSFRAAVTSVAHQSVQLCNSGYQRLKFDAADDLVFEQTAGSMPPELRRSAAQTRGSAARP